MSFSRSFLKGFGLSEEQTQAIMEEHVAVTDALKQQLEAYKSDAEKLPEVQKKLDALNGAEDYKAMYEKEHEQFETYKADVQAKEEHAELEKALRQLARDAGLSENGIGKVAKYTDYSALKLNKDGSLANADRLRETIRAEWPEHIVTERTEHEKIATPPEVKTGSKLSREEIFRRDDKGRYVLSTEERQKAIAENPQAFQ